MDDTPKLPAGRKATIASYVKEAGQVTVTELAEHFKVSVDTIRRDLDQLDSDGILIRTHGGAMAPSALPWHDTGLDARERLQPSQKDTIGRLAAQLVTDGSVLVINAGTTALAMTPYLSNRRELIVATNNLLIPSRINPESCRDLYVIGGHVRLSGQVSIGPVSFANLVTGEETRIQFDFAFIGIGAVDAEEGFSTTNLDEAAMLRQMAQRATRVAILADSSKLNKRLFANVGSLSLADFLITDSEPEAPLTHALKKHGVTVIHPGSPLPPVSR